MANKEISREDFEQLEERERFYLGLDDGYEGCEPFMPDDETYMQGYEQGEEDFENETDSEEDDLF